MCTADISWTLFEFSTEYPCHVLLIRAVASASVFLLTGWLMTHRMDVAEGRDVVARWCILAEQRLEHLTELFETGRWRRYHSELAFLENIQEAKTAVETWRGLSAPKARDNSAIDISWLGRRVAPTSGRATLPNRVDQPLSRPAQIAAELPTQDVSIVPEADQVSSEEMPSAPDSNAPAMDTAPCSPSELTLDIAVMQERYPLLRNAL
jgi:uncharacterized repeat protein (TIGR03809 family)